MGNVQFFVFVIVYIIVVFLFLLLMKFIVLLILVCLLVLFVVVLVQEVEFCNWVVIVENVKFDYVQVLNVELVFQILCVICIEEYCELVLIWILVLVNVIGEELVEDKGWISCFWDLVCLMFKCSDEEVVEEVGIELLVLVLVNNGFMLICDCCIVLVGCEFCWFIVYDVDYVYKGIKYCLWLLEDFGNWFKIWVLIMFWVGFEQGLVGNF